MSANSEEVKPFEDLRTGMAIVWCIARVWATSLEVFIHVGVGARYPGFHGALVVLLIPLYTLAWPQHDLVPLMIFFATYLAMCVWQRVLTWRRPALRASTHSYYNGYPVICHKCPRLSEQKAKQFVEPVLGLAIGFLLSLLNAPMGWYVMIGSGCLWLSFSMCSQLQSERAMDMQDAMLEQKQLMERFRESRQEE